MGATRFARVRPAALAAAALSVAMLASVLTASTAAAGTCPTIGGGGIVSPAPAAGVDWSGCALAGANLSHAILFGADLTGADLTAANLDHANIAGARLGHAVLHGAVLTGVSGSGASFDHADLSAADLTAAQVTSASWIGTDLTGTHLVANLTGARSSSILGAPSVLPANFMLVNGALLGPSAQVFGVDLSGMDLTGAKLNLAALSSVNLAGANLTNAVLTGASLIGVDLTGTNLLGATLTSARGSLLTGQPTGVGATWSVTSGYLVGPGANLIGARLSGADLAGRSLAAAKLTGAALDGADLTAADLTGATLTDAVMTRVKLGQAVLTGAVPTRVRSGGITGTPTSLPVGWRLAMGHLVGASAVLTYADLRGADLSSMSLTGVDLTGALLTGSDLSGSDLSGAMLEHVTADHVNLHGSNLASADLGWMMLEHADLRGAHFENAYLFADDMSYAVLTGATGLTAANVSYPSWGGATCPDAILAEAHVHGDCLLAHDLTAPTLTTYPMPEFWTPGNEATMAFRFVATDQGSGILSTTFRYREAPAGALGYRSWQQATANDPTGTIVWAGGWDSTRTCAQARAVDWAGNVAWSSERCSTTLTDDGDLTSSSAWHHGVAGAMWMDNYASTTSHGATLATHSARYVRHLGVMAKTCPSCGSVSFYVGRTKVGTISLRATKDSYRRLLLLPRFSTQRHGVVKLVVTSASGRRVTVDGLAISAY